jgi:hypothetical protein
MKNKTVEMVLKDWLKAKGLCNKNCGCGIDDLLVCESNCMLCTPAVKRYFDGEYIFVPIKNK